jgi:hypothetical protein
MIRKQTFILLVVFAALVGLVFILRKSPLPTSAGLTPSPTAQPSLLDGWKSDDIQQIQFQDSQGSYRVIKNVVSGWLKDTDARPTVEPGAMEQAAAAIIDLRPLAALSAGGDLSVYGLSTPDYVITLTDKQNRTAVIRIGKVTATGSGYYVQTGETSPVTVVVKDSVESILEILKKEQNPQQPSDTPAP